MRLLPLFITISLCLGSVHAEAQKCKKPITIAVIDTGFGIQGLGKSASLCKYGHKNFTKDPSTAKNLSTKTPVPLDTYGHGTNVVGIIDEIMKKSGQKYCIIVIKAFSDGQSAAVNVENSIKSFRYVSFIKPDFVNYSGGGGHYSDMEYKEVAKVLANGTKIVAAAGNDGRELGAQGNYYPAMYDKRITVVGNLGKHGGIHFLSNYGSPVTRYEIGQDVSGFDIVATGTSQATAKATGKMASTFTKRCDR